MKIYKKKATIKGIREQTEDLREFLLEIDEEFEFKAGQFVNLIIEEENEKKIKRPYSIASNPNQTNKFELYIKKVEGGEMTSKIWKLKEGDQINIMGPLGLFSYDFEEKNDKILLVGVGTGIAPLRSILKDLLTKKIEKEIKLIYGVKYKKELCYDKEFKEIEKLFPNFKYVPVCSREGEEWEGMRGHVQDHFLNIQPLNTSVFLCGLPEMVEESIEKLESIGVPRENIKHEKF